MHADRLLDQLTLGLPSWGPEASGFLVFGALLSVAGPHTLARLGPRLVSILGPILADHEKDPTLRLGLLKVRGGVARGGLRPDPKFCPGSTRPTLPCPALTRPALPWPTVGGLPAGGFGAWPSSGGWGRGRCCCPAWQRAAAPVGVAGRQDRGSRALCRHHSAVHHAHGWAGTSWGAE